MCHALVLTLSKALYEGSFHYHSMGHESGFSKSGEPVKYFYRLHGIF
ncbi:hypothetical protein OLMES_5383 [Oleiphilus messinensis]|uniref:Uncharacterized protein n=1 Tax=Oleiphilus messinensis TaxID=141451 RepID=A0A1Y0IIV2_9GAMM|nr:hypothetical protein OLMES_5383 [Oleiphilus messinensis]